MRTRLAVLAAVAALLAVLGVLWWPRGGKPSTTASTATFGEQYRAICESTGGEFVGCPQCPMDAVCEPCGWPCKCPQRYFHPQRGCRPALEQFQECSVAGDTCGPVRKVAGASAEAEYCLNTRVEANFRQHFAQWSKLEQRSYYIPSRDELSPSERGFACRCVDSLCTWTK